MIKFLTVGNSDDIEYVRAAYESAADEAWRTENPIMIETALVHLEVLNDLQLSEADYTEKYIDGPMRAYLAYSASQPPIQFS